MINYEKVKEDIKETLTEVYNYSTEEVDVWVEKHIESIIDKMYDAISDGIENNTEVK